MNVRREGSNQYWKGRKIKISTILSQFKENIVDVDGSKIENRFIIIIKVN